MPRISSNDRAVALLRIKLAKLASSRGNAKISSSNDRKQRDELAEIIAERDLPDQAFAEKFVKIILTQELGEYFASNPASKKIIQETAEALLGDPTLKDIALNLRNSKS